MGLDRAGEMVLDAYENVEIAELENDKGKDKKEDQSKNNAKIDLSTEFQKQLYLIKPENLDLGDDRRYSINSATIITKNAEQIIVEIKATGSSRGTSINEASEIKFLLGQ